MQQLDIFDDSRDVMLRNALAEALAAGSTGAARAAAAALRAEFPGDPALGTAAVLLHECEAAQTPITDAKAPDTLREQLQSVSADPNMQ